MFITKEIRSLVIASSLTALGVVALFSYIAHTRIEAYREMTTSSLEGLEKQFLLRAEETGRNQVVAESKNIIFDCNARTRFEELLSRLVSLTQNERNELDVLFPACGDYPVRLKSYLVGTLEGIARAYEIHSAYSNIFFSTHAQNTEVLELMKKIIALEKERASLMRTQVFIQGDINAALNQGKGVAGKTIEELAADGTSLGGAFITINAAIDEARTALAALLKK